MDTNLASKLLILAHDISGKRTNSAEYGNILDWITVGVLAELYEKQKLIIKLSNSEMVFSSDKLLLSDIQVSTPILNRIIDEIKSKFKNNSFSFDELISKVFTRTYKEDLLRILEDDLIEKGKLNITSEFFRSKVYKFPDQHFILNIQDPLRDCLTSDFMPDEVTFYLIYITSKMNTLHLILGIPGLVNMISEYEAEKNRTSSNPTIKSIQDKVDYLLGPGSPFLHNNQKMDIGIQLIKQVISTLSQ